jgi:preprotein translocase subunit SecD
LVKSKIPGGRSLLEGIETLEEAKLLEIMLNAGALEAPWEIISKKTQD